MIQGNFTHTFEGAAPQTCGPGSVWSQPARQVHDDKCEEGGDCIIAVYFNDIGRNSAASHRRPSEIALRSKRAGTED